MTTDQRTITARPVVPRYTYRRTAQGSVLVMGYFVVVVLLGLAIPQTLRSLNAVQLEQRYVRQQSLLQVAEAGLDEALRRFWTTPMFGYPGVTGYPEDNASSNYYAGGFGVQTCERAGWTPKWDCLTTSNAVLPDYTDGAPYWIYAQDLTPPYGGNGPSHKLVRKRVRIVARYPNSPPGTADLVLEAVVVVARKEEKTGVKANGRFQIMVGNGVEDIIVHGEEIYVFGPVTGIGWNDAPIHVGGSQAIWGKVYVNNSGTPVCCYTGAGATPVSAVGLTNSGFGLNARIRQYNPNDNFFVGDTLVRADPSTWQAPIVARDWNDGTAPEDVGFTTAGLSTNPAHAADLPDFMQGNPPADFQPVEMRSSDPGCAARAIEIAGGSGNVATFCKEGETAGVCADDADPKTTVYRIGKEATVDGETTVEYCMQYLQVGEGVKLRFQGDNVHVYATGHSTYSGWEYAYWIRANSNAYSFKTANVDPGWADLAFADINYAGKLSLRVPGSNLYDDDGDGAATDVPKVVVSSDVFYGTVYAPASVVEFSVIKLDDRYAGSMVGRETYFTGNQGRGYYRIRPQSVGERNRVTGVSLLAWHRCRNAACTQ